MDSKILASFLVVFVAFIAIAQSAPNNSTIPASPSKNDTAIPSLKNATSTGKNASSSSSEEDCDLDSGAGNKSKNGTKTSGQREGKQLNLSDKDMYKHEDPASKTNATSSASSPGDAEKLQGNATTTTVAPATGGSVKLTPHLLANVIFATIISSFTYSAL